MKCPCSLLLSFLVLGLAANASTENTSKSVAHKAPAVINAVAPEYPADARAMGLEGVVVIQCLVDARGDVLAVGSLEEEKTILSASAIAAVKQWKFEARAEATPILVQVPIHFDLQQSKHQPDTMSMAAR